MPVDFLKAEVGFGGMFLVIGGWICILDGLGARSSACERVVNRVILDSGLVLWPSLQKSMLCWTNYGFDRVGG